MTSPRELALEIESLRFRYARGVDHATPADGMGSAGEDGWVIAIDHLTVAPAEQLLLRGGSGSGKSTLLQLIAGLIDPHYGSIRIDGTAMHDLRGAARDRFRGRNIGMIFQTFNLLHGFSAAENVMAALMFTDQPRSEHRARALGLLQSLGIDGADRDPQQMSVGQQQRVAVARAVAARPVLLLADEPTASLDPENATAAMDLIQSMARETQAALVCVSHDPAMAQRFERVEDLASFTPTSSLSTPSTAGAA
ncbi:MAG: ABC transporter ATP-binding protein [Phycisphaerales bacterium]